MVKQGTPSPNQSAAANRRYALSFVGHWFYNIIGFGERALPAPVAELGRYVGSGRPVPHGNPLKMKNGRCFSTS